MGKIYDYEAGDAKAYIGGVAPNVDKHQKNLKSTTFNDKAPRPVKGTRSPKAATGK